MRTARPRPTRCAAAARPTGPAPMMATGSSFRGSCGFTADLLAVSWYCRRACNRGTGFRRAAAAIRGEIGEQRVHGLVARGIDERPSLAPHADEPGLAQPVEVEGKRVRGQRERRRDLARGHALRAGLDEEPEHVEPVVLRERAERRDGLALFHNSTT